MNLRKLRQIQIKKAQMLIDKKIGDKQRLEKIQLKVARGLPMFAENQAYLNALVLENLSEEEIQLINKEVETAKLEKLDIMQQNQLRCVCCGNVAKRLDGGGMCTNCFRDYALKISKFFNGPTPGGGGIV